MNYPDRIVVADLLAEVGRRAADQSSSNHPVDIASAMANAIESGALLIEVAMKKGLI